MSAAEDQDHDRPTGRGGAGRVRLDAVEDLAAELVAARRDGRRINASVWAVAVGTMIYGAVSVTRLLVEHDVSIAYAWMLSPMVDAGLCVALWGGRMITRYGLSDGWVTALRWVCALTTLVLNTARPALHTTGEHGRWAPDWVGVGIHAVGPVLLLVLAEAAGRLGAHTTAIVAALAHAAAQNDTRARSAAAELAAARDQTAAAREQTAAALARAVDAELAAAQATADAEAARAERDTARAARADRPPVDPAAGDPAATPHRDTHRDPAREHRESHPDRDTGTGTPDPTETEAAAGTGTPAGSTGSPTRAGSDPRTRGPAAPSAERQDGATPTERAWAHWSAERAAGRTPTGADLDRVAGTRDYGRGLRRRWLTAEQAAAADTSADRPDPGVGGAEPGAPDTTGAQLRIV